MISPIPYSTNNSTNSARLSALETRTTALEALSNPYKARATRTSSQTINDNSYTLVQLNAETFDTNSNFDTGTYQYTVPVTGYYQVNAKVTFYDDAAKLYQGRICIYIDGAIYHSVASVPSSGGTMTIFGACIADLIYLTAAQTVDLRVYGDTTDSGTFLLSGSGNEQPYLTIHLVSKT